MFAATTNVARRVKGAPSASRPVTSIGGNSYRHHSYVAVSENPTRPKRRLSVGFTFAITRASKPTPVQMSDVRPAEGQVVSVRVAVEDEELRRFLGGLSEAELPGDDVRRPRGEDRERDVTPDERARRLGDGPVASGDGDEVRPVREPLGDELGGVAGPLGREEGENDPAPPRPLGDRRHLRGPVASSRRRVVDEEAAPHAGPSKRGPVAVLGGRPRCR